MSLKTVEEVKLQVRAQTPNYIIDIIAVQMDRVIESRERIKNEGIVVRDIKGSVIQHPAIKVEADSIKIIADLIAKYKK